MKVKTLFGSVMWGSAKEVQDILNNRDLTIDDNYSDYALLLCSLRHKRKEISKILLNKGCRVKKLSQDENTSTPLHLAVKLGDDIIVKILLDKGAEIDVKDENGETPLHLAIYIKTFNKRLVIVDLLLSAVKVDCVNVNDKDQFTHFHIACMANKIDAVKKFLNNGVDVNSSVNFESKKWSGYTGLHFAVEFGCIDIVELLLNFKANLAVKNAEDKTPLHLAVQKRHLNIANIILSSISCYDFNPVNDNGISHFHIACRENHLKAVENFLYHGIDINQAVNLTSYHYPGYTALHFAIKGSSENFEARLPLIELLLAHKADVSSQDKIGQTPLHLACFINDEKILNTIDKSIGFLDEKVEIVDLLLKYKSDVNIKDNSDETPIFYLFKNDDRDMDYFFQDDKKQLLNSVYKILERKRFEIFKILLKHDANVDVINDMGEWLLHLLFSLDNVFDDDQIEMMAKLIIEKSKKINVTTKSGLTPLHIAASKGKVNWIKLLINHNANVNVSEFFHQSTPLLTATTYQQVEAVKILLENGADVTAVNDNGRNVLHLMACRNPVDWNSDNLLLSVNKSYKKIIDLFIEHGCDIDAQDVKGRTPLHLAFMENNYSSIKILLSHCADINVLDFVNETPLSFFIDHIMSGIEDFLIKHVIMLKTAGLYINSVNEKIFAQKITLISRHNDFTIECKKEIEKMKIIMINNRTSLFDILSKDKNEMFSYANNEILFKVLNSNDFDIYKNLLGVQFRKGKSRKILYKNAKDSFERMIKLSLPDLCIHEIFRYLSNDNLNDLAKAHNVEIFDNNCKVLKTTRQIHDRIENLSLEKAIAYCRSLSGSKQN